jgi:hypothetical protein
MGPWRPWRPARLTWAHEVLVASPVADESDLRLAIRTIAVTSRAAIDSSRKTGRKDLAVESARRGLALLEAVRERLDADVSDDVSQQLEAAVRELTSAADPAADDPQG